MNKIVALDVHSEWSQLTAMSGETGEILLEMKVRAEAEELRRVVCSVPGPKKVLFEEGPMVTVLKSGTLRTAQMFRQVRSTL